MSIFREIGVREGKDRRGEELLYNLACCYTQAEQILSKLLAVHGLSPVKMNALLIVRHVGKKEGIAQRELARRMIVSAGNVTRLVDRLEKEELITRTLSAADRRVKYIRITPKAAGMLDRAWPFYKKKVDEIAGLATRRTGTAVKMLNDYRIRLSEKITKENA